MQDLFIELIYDNFMLVFWVAIACIIFVFAFTTWIVKHQIGTKVLIIRDTTGEVVAGKENLGEGTVKIKKKLYKKIGEPIVMQSLLRPYRMYFHEEGSQRVISPSAYMPNVTTDTDKEGVETDTITKANVKPDANLDLLYQKLLESEIVEQSVRGLVGSTMEKIILICAGGGIGIILWEIIKGIFGGGA